MGVRRRSDRGSLSDWSRDRLLGGAFSGDIGQFEDERDRQRWQTLMWNGGVADYIAKTTSGWPLGAGLNSGA